MTEGVKADLAFFEEQRAVYRHFGPNAVSPCAMEALFDAAIVSLGGDVLEAAEMPLQEAETAVEKPKRTQRKQS